MVSAFLDEDKSDPCRCGRECARGSFRKDTRLWPGRVPAAFVNEVSVEVCEHDRESAP